MSWAVAVGNLLDGAVFVFEEAPLVELFIKVLVVDPRHKNTPVDL